MGGSPGVVVSTAAFHARVRGSVTGLGGLKKTKMFLPHAEITSNHPVQIVSLGFILIHINIDQKCF